MQRVSRYDNINKLIAFHRWKSSAPSQDAVVIANFANMNYPYYDLNFPSTGDWYVQFNSDSTNYGTDYRNIGSTVVTASGSLSRPPLPSVLTARSFCRKFPMFRRS